MKKEIIQTTKFGKVEVNIWTNAVVVRAEDFVFNGVKYRTASIDMNRSAFEETYKWDNTYRYVSRRDAKDPTWEQKQRISNALFDAVIPFITQEDMEAGIREGMESEIARKQAEIIQLQEKTDKLFAEILDLKIKLDMPGGR